KAFLTSPECGAALSPAAVAASLTRVPNPPLTYRDAGVDIDASDQMEDRIRAAVHRTYGPRVLPSHGGFAGLFRLDYDGRIFAKNYREPVLVACTDGVGSKVLVGINAG